MFSTVWNTQRDLQSWVEKRRGREEIEATWWPKLMCIESVMPSNRLILCHPLLLPPIPPSIRVFSNESTLHIRWPKYWSFSFNISPSNDGNPLQCSCLENPRDGEAWWAAVYGVAQSRTRLKQLSSSSSSSCLELQKQMPKFT